ncbi:Transcriptional regulatory protein YehT [Caloramator mitchellensis]|uniref:Stage 0 sporulation protein A homolog n=1 Tax=Caloramator mitchellensis TaxID=908809 RepID=A0A0R3JVN3_CALMK|nr:response regulator [Caloramator mitchellensis]KRQ86365.1 Transcriptional regulatory protein YehT [Caloramator mitchellensis]
MLNILIADDEYLVIDYLKMIIEKNFDDINIIGTASTGREAIEKAISLKPDVVFMDIHMPGINGIEAIRQIKNTNNDVYFVILTAFEYFDYAKEALSLGVFEYLLKPVSKAKLVETINNLNSAIDKKRKSFLNEVELKERIDRIVPFLEGQFVSYKMYNIGTLNDVAFYENVFNMNLKKGYALCLMINSSNPFERQNFYDLFKIKLKSITTCLIGNPLSDRVVAFIPYEEKTSQKDVGKRIEEKLKTVTNTKYKIGIGRVYELENFNKSSNEAYIAATINNGKNIVYFDEIYIKDAGDDFPLHLETAFSNSILTGNFEEARKIFNEIFIKYSFIYSEDVDKIKTKLIELAFNMDKMLPYKLEDRNNFKQMFILSIIKTQNTLELRNQFIQYINEISTEIQNQKKEHVDDIIAKVLEFINKNYNQDISLYDAARSVNLSYHYLSKIFKDEIGKGFVDYLTELRIEKSIQLLSNQKISIKEICQNIGYNDPNYYCKIFKKVTGMTPSEFRMSKGLRGDLIG